jgi:hypothetical protein
MSDEKERKDAAAVRLGRKGGEARARNLSEEELRQIGLKGARKRWGAKKKERS